MSLHQQLPKQKTVVNLCTTLTKIPLGSKNMFKVSVEVIFQNSRNVKSKQNKNFSSKKLQGFLSNYGIVLASQKTLASIASVVLYLLERPNPYRVKYGKTMTAEEPIRMKDL